MICLSTDLGGWVKDIWVDLGDFSQQTNKRLRLYRGSLRSRKLNRIPLEDF